MAALTSALERHNYTETNVNAFIEKVEDVLLDVCADVTAEAVGGASQPTTTQHIARQALAYNVVRNSKSFAKLFGRLLLAKAPSFDPDNSTSAQYKNQVSSLFNVVAFDGTNAV